MKTGKRALLQCGDRGRGIGALGLKEKHSLRTLDGWHYGIWILASSPEAAYPLPSKAGLPWVWTSVGTLGFLNKELPFHGEKQAHRAQLALGGPSRDFNLVWAALGPTQWRGSAISWMSIFFCTGGECKVGTLFPQRLGLRQERVHPDLGERLSAAWHLRY